MPQVQYEPVPGRGNILRVTRRAPASQRRLLVIVPARNLMQHTAIGQRMTFDIDIMVRLYRAGTPVHFLPTRVTYPENGISHSRPLQDNLAISWMHTRLTCNMLCSLPQLL